MTFLLTRPLRDVTRPSTPVMYSTTISTHTPLAGRDFVCPVEFSDYVLFLLTRPLRDVTGVLLHDVDVTVDFYSHAPCGT